MEWWLLLIIGLMILACPLLMRFGMRGMHGGQGHACGSQHTGDADVAGPEPTQRLRELEREINQLKEQLPTRNDGETTDGIASGGPSQPAR